MLKSAREIQQLSEEAKREALEEARLKVKLEEDQRRTIERRKNDLLEFERRAIAAAISGQGSIAIADLELDTEQLEALGFAVQKLTRRSQYENSLSQRAIAGRYQLEKRVEAMLSACPSFRFITDSEMRFRNPLMSLFESMWSIKFASAKKHASSVLASLYSTPEIDRIWIDENNDRIGDCLRIFSEVKLLESRLSEIRWENQQIPVGADSCYFIEWDLAPAISGISALYLMHLWYSGSWTLGRRWPNI